LVERYEELREDALSGTGISGELRGVAVLVRKGMSAWIRAWCGHKGSLWDERGRPPFSVAVTPDMPRNLVSEVVSILTSMALCAQEEVRR
jgi:hypothetical protein